VARPGDLTPLIIPVTLLALIPAVGLAPSEFPFALVAATIAFAYALISYRSLTAGFAIFVGLTFLDRAGDTVGAGITVARVFGALLAAVWLAVLWRRHTTTPIVFRELPIYGGVLLLLAGWALFANVWAPDYSVAISSTTRFMQGLIVIPIAYSAMREVRHLILVLGVFTISCTALGVISLFSSPAGDRISGGFDDPNEFAAVLVPSAVFAAAAAIAPFRPAVRLAAVGVMLLDLYCLIHTDSQGGLVALGTVIVAGVFIGGSQRRITLGIALTAVIGSLFFVTLVGSTSGLTEGGNSRENLWRVTLAVARDHPLVGIGPGNFPVVEPSYAYRTIEISRPDLILKSYVSHNTYLQVLAEYGFVGLVLFLGVLAGALGLGLRAARRLSASEGVIAEVMARAALAGTVGLLAAYFFLSSQYEKQLWILVGLCVALDAVSRRRTTVR